MTRQEKIDRIYEVIAQVVYGEPLRDVLGIIP